MRFHRLALIGGVFLLALCARTGVGLAQTLTLVTKSFTPWAVAVSSIGDVYIVDNTLGEVVKLVGGTGSPVVVATGLSAPTGVAVAGNGDVYIAERGMNRVVKLVGGTGSPDVVYTGGDPFGLTVASNGDVYFTDNANGQVVKLEGGSGSPVVVTTGLSYPWGVAVADNGDVYIAERGTNRVLKLEGGTGSPVAVLEGEDVTGVAMASNGDVYLAEYSSDRVAKLVGGAGSPVEVATGLSSPLSVAVGADGDVFIVDVDFGRVLKLEGGTGSPVVIAATGLAFPAGLAVASNGDVYVADRGGRMVKLEGGAGSPLEVTTGLNGPFGVAVASNGDVYIADTFNNRVVKLVDGIGNPVEIATGLNIPYGVAAASNGDVYIADTSNNRVIKLVGGNGNPVEVATGLSGPLGVAVASDGDVYLTDNLSGRVLKLVGGTGNPVEILTGLGFPVGVAVSSSGDVYIVEETAGRVLRLAGGTGSPVEIAAGFSYPADVAVSSTGDVYITDMKGLWKLTAPTPLSFMLGRVSGETGEAVSVPITLTNPNTTAVGGLEWQVIRGSSAIQFDSLATAVFGFAASTNTIGDTTFIVFHSPSGAVIAPGVTPLGVLRYRIEADAPLCTPIPLTIRSLAIGDSLGFALPDSAIDGEIQAGIPGDVNLDRQISIFDVIKLVRVIVGKDTEPDSSTCQFFIADFNGDDGLDILDVIGQVNVILRLTKQIAALAPTTATIRLGAAQTDASGGLVVPVELQSDGLIAGLQATVRFDPSAVSVGTPVLAGSAAGLSLDASVKSGVLRFVVFGSQPGQGIVARSGAVLLIPITLRNGTNELPSLELSDVVVASAQAQRVPVTIGAPVKAAALPMAFSLSVNRPNPFNPSTQIAYEVPQQAQITLAVYNVLGQEVARLVNAVQQAGHYTVTWDGRNAQGQAVSSGVYLYRLASSTGYIQSRRMVLLK